MAIAKNRPTYQLVIDLRAVGYVVLVALWLLLLSALFYEHFYWERYPWFVTKFYPPIKWRPGMLDWWTSHWPAVCAAILFSALAIFAFLLNGLSRVVRQLSPVLRGVLLFALALIIGLYGSYIEFKWMYPLWDILRPTVLALGSGIVLVAAQKGYGKLRNRYGVRRLIR